MRTLKERREDYKLKKQQDQFKSMIKELAEKEEFTLRDYRKQIQDHLKSQQSGFMRLMSGTSQEESETIDSRKVLNALKDEELLDHKLVDSEVRKEVSQVVQLNIQQVNKVISAYKMELKLHAYLKARRERKEHLPESQEELHLMMTADRPPPAFEEKEGLHKKVSDRQRRMWQYKH